ncbi:MAG TPA: PKD domain-containing protein, partial [Solirubrobacterales bacterium]|nr:PKD domain-containing protein [Solirubrobacterales bacterium]
PGSVQLSDPCPDASGGYGNYFGDHFAVAPDGRWSAAGGERWIGAVEFDRSQGLRSFGVSGGNRCEMSQQGPLPRAYTADGALYVLDTEAARVAMFGRHYEARGCGFNPTVDLSADNLTPAVGEDVTFTATPASPEALLPAWYEWDLDGDPNTGQEGFEAGADEGQQVAVFATAGTYDIRVRANDTDGSGSEEPATVTLTVKAVAPEAKLDAPTRGFAGEAVRLDASRTVEGTDAIAKYEFDTGTGTFDTDNGIQPVLKKTFGAPGIYAVRVRVTDTGSPPQSSIASATITVEQVPLVDPPASGGSGGGGGGAAPSGGDGAPSLPVRPTVKPLKCRKGFVKKRVKGKPKCVRKATKKRR